MIRACPKRINFNSTNEAEFFTLLFLHELIGCIGFGQIEKNLEKNYWYFIVLGE